MHMADSHSQDQSPIWWLWNVIVVAALAYEGVEKLWELRPTVADYALDKALYLVVAVNVLNHAARIGDMRHRLSSSGFSAIFFGALIGAFGLWWNWHDVILHCEKWSK